MSGIRTAANVTESTAKADSLAYSRATKASESALDPTTYGTQTEATSNPLSTCCPCPRWCYLCSSAYALHTSLETSTTYENFVLSHLIQELVRLQNDNPNICSVILLDPFL
ncbi:hypothetical protein Ancab_014836 [Ancistrocladus abbreviatus]